MKGGPAISLTSKNLYALSKFFAVLQKFMLQSRTLYFLLLLGPSLGEAARIYVDADASPGGDGTSWASAYKFLQDGLADTVSGRGDEVWIAEGVYYPDNGINLTAGNRSASFLLKDGVELYGGFNGTETDRHQRDWEAHFSTLSGKIVAASALWSYHVTTVENSATVVFDGVTITGGRANGISDRRRDDAAGVYFEDTSTKVIARNSVFSDHHSDGGGGVARGGIWEVEESDFLNNRAGSGGVAENGNWTVSKSTFSGNNAGIGGVARGGSWVVVESIFENNTGRTGGGVSWYGTWAVVNAIVANNSAQHGGVSNGSDWRAVNSLFYGNSSSRYGGVAYKGIWEAHSSTFVANTANYGGGISYEGYWSLLNSIVVGEEQTFDFYEVRVFDNTDNSRRGKILIKGGIERVKMWSGSPNFGEEYFIETDPDFVDELLPKGPDDLWGTADDGLRLNISSSARDTGVAQTLPPDEFDVDGDNNILEALPSDILGNQRLGDAGLDLGAYESVLHIIEATSGVGGSVNPSGAVEVLSDSNLSIVAIPEPNYEFDSWSGDASGSNNPLAVAVDQNKTITANFVRLYHIELSAGSGGSISPSGATSNPVGSTVTVTATADLGYLFDSWTGDATGSDNPLILTVDQNKTVAAAFVKDIGDADNDGLINHDELVTYGSNPELADTSGDGLEDGVVAAAGFDPTTDYTALISGGNLEVDSDGNGLTDSFESAPDAMTLNSLGYYSEAQLMDGRAGSTMISANGDGTFTLELELMESVDLQSWAVTDTISRNVSFEGDQKFFRFRVKD